MEFTLKKIIALLAAVLLTLPLLASCSSKDAVLKAGSHDIGYDEYRYFYMNYYSEYVPVEGEDSREVIRERTANAIKLRYAKVDYAAKLGITLDGAEKQSVEDKIAGIKEKYGERYEEYLAENFITEDVMRQLFTEEALEIKVRNHESNEFTSSFRFDDETVKEYVKKNFYRAKQILLKDEGDPKSEDNRFKAESILALAKEGGDFDVLVANFSEDTAMGPDGYCFAKGQMNAEFESVVKKLRTREVSDVFTTAAGFHIVKRLEIDDELVYAHLNELTESYKAAMINSIFESEAEKITVERTDYFYKLAEQMLIDGVKPQ